MKTLKLYETDAYISRFEAAVISCEADERGYRTLLDKTAFFPEGGGQPSDTGALSGIEVFDVQILSGEMYHYTKTPFEVGDKVIGEIDFARRFNFMQNHTAEHIVSGLVHAGFGYDNIGFHLNENEVSFDFNGFFTPRELTELEYAANERVWRNLAVSAYYPDENELKNTPYRAKDGIDGEIRLVKIEDTDLCACCAPHVKSTGEIGIIKFLGTENQHGGTRIFMKCGAFALKDYRQKTEDIKAVCEMLSAKTEDLRDAVFAQNSRLEAQKQAVKKLKARLIKCETGAFDPTKAALVFEDADMRELQELADGLHKTYGGVRTALSPGPGGAAFAMCGKEPEITEEFSRLKSRFEVKGGGRDMMRQGNITAPYDEISEFFGIRESL